MTCRERPHVVKVLTGDLSPAKSNAMLEHFRRCGECREAFEFAAKTMTRAGAVYGGVATPAPDDGGGALSGGWRGSWSPSMRRNRRTLIVFGVAIAALMIAGVGRGKGGGDASLLPAEVFWRHAIAEGTPVVQAPLGSSEARPRVIMGLLPVGCPAGRVMVLDDSGKVVFEREAKGGFDGCFVEETAIEAPGGAFRAGRLLVPFPDEAALGLVPGRGYGVVIAAAGGHASAAAAFQVRPAEGPLHEPRAETR